MKKLGFLYHSEKKANGDKFTRVEVYKEEPPQKPGKPKRPTIEVLMNWLKYPVKFLLTILL